MAWHHVLYIIICYLYFDVAIHVHANASCCCCCASSCLQARPSTYCCAEMDNADAMQDVHVHVQRELAVLDQPMSTVGDVAMGLEVTFLNSAVDSVGE